MNIKFDSNQPHQRKSTDAVLGLFGGQPRIRVCGGGGNIVELA